MTENKQKEAKIAELQKSLSEIDNEDIKQKVQKLKEYESVGSKEDIIVLKTKLEQYEKMESTLQNALLYSQKACDQMKESA